MFRIVNMKHQKEEIVRVRLVTTFILSSTSSSSSSPSSSSSSSQSSLEELTYHLPSGQKNGYFTITCCEGTVLGILELQPQGKKVMTAKAFNNGLRDKKVYCLPIEGTQHIQPDKNSH